MKKVFLTILFSATLFSVKANQCVNDNCKSACDDGNTIFGAPGQIKQCEYEWGRTGPNRHWEDHSGVCVDSIAFNATKHTWVKQDGGSRNRCWKAKCTAGFSQFGNLAECIACEKMNEVVQNGICYQIDCKVGKDDGNVIFIVDGAPKCMPVCDVKTVGEYFDASDETKLTFKIRKKTASTLGERDTETPPAATGA